MTIAAIDRHGTVRILLDLTDFHGEKVSAWGADLHFGRQTTTRSIAWRS